MIKGFETNLQHLESPNNIDLEDSNIWWRKTMMLESQNDQEYHSGFFGGGEAWRYPYDPQTNLMKRRVIAKSVQPNFGFGPLMAINRQLMAINGH